MTRQKSKMDVCTRLYHEKESSHIEMLIEVILNSTDRASSSESPGSQSACPRVVWELSQTAHCTRERKGGKYVQGSKS